ncbi:AraC family transcriptional regulator [Paenibacillus doosanensis]|uniref:HTH-type transcriptional activator RhaS n=1 Tax=Paenibacillus konkukensis TaxID=2020716 RepID=A0ABY4RL97_9BACL|nr:MULTISPECIES: AraC family transcriptional regulator [Paenibacillus]MCS7464383.1 AraC family transcriptional regulator [Paenibacillus doosanensis]UQZ83277.1 HTH-type transcriptional activator RhaS [Paenibacillus konkukensis]
MKTDFEIHFAKQAENPAMDMYHYHDFYEIYYLFGGERFYYLENHIYHVAKGSVVFVNKNDIHKTLEGGAGHDRAVLYFTDRFLGRFTDEQLKLLLSPFRSSGKVMPFNNQQQSYIENLLFQMKKEYADSSLPGRSLFFESLLVQLLLFTSRISMEAEQIAPKPMDGKMSEIIGYCNENYVKPLTLESVSSRFFISPYYFSRLFKRSTGFHFPEYINTLRIREAQRLLREDDGKIIQIAERVGYSNITHFNRTFKQVTGMAPLTYKKMIRSVPKT